MSRRARTALSLHLVSFSFCFLHLPRPVDVEACEARGWVVCPTEIKSKERALIRPRDCLGAKLEKTKKERKRCSLSFHLRMMRHQRPQRHAGQQVRGKTQRNDDNNNSPCKQRAVLLHRCCGGVFARLFRGKCLVCACAPRWVVRGSVASCVPHTTSPLPVTLPSPLKTKKNDAFEK